MSFVLFKNREENRDLILLLITRYSQDFTVVGFSIVFTFYCCCFVDLLIFFLFGFVEFVLVYRMISVYFFRPLVLPFSFHAATVFLQQVEFTYTLDKLTFFTPIDNVQFSFFSSSFSFLCLFNIFYILSNFMRDKKTQRDFFFYIFIILVYLKKVNEKFAIVFFFKLFAVTF